MSGIGEKIATAFGESFVVRFLKRLFGTDGESDVTEQVRTVVETLPDNIDSMEELQESCEFLDGLEIEQEIGRESYLPPKKIERKSINSD